MSLPASRIDRDFYRLPFEIAAVATSKFVLMPIKPAKKNSRIYNKVLCGTFFGSLCFPLLISFLMQSKLKTLFFVKQEAIFLRYRGNDDNETETLYKVGGNIFQA